MEEKKNSGENEKAALLLLDRASRATRGKRLSKLLDDEVQQDELFWSQDALKEEDEDDNYQEEAEIADEFDSDFDQDVSLLFSLSNSLTHNQLIQLTLLFILFHFLRSLNLMKNSRKLMQMKE
jgi:hypothetical protein